MRTKTSQKWKSHIVVGLSLISISGANAGVNNILNNVMATINKDAQISGPIYRHEKRNIEKYGDQVATILLQEAHRQAKRFLDEGNPKAYYGFMALALTVPNQEGLMVHFREVEADKDYCRDKRSEGKNIASKTAKENFQKTFNGKGGFFSRNKEGFLVPCKDLRGENTYRQLIVGGSDGSDVGIMQVSVLWHYDNFLAEDKYTSVRETIRYGLGYIMGRYRRAFRKSVSRDSKHACFIDGNQINYRSLIRGSWSAYNGGPSQICRFSNPSDPHAPKDKHFKGNLNLTLNLNNGGFFGFTKADELTLTRNVRNAVEEVITNFENDTNKRSALESIL